MIKRIFERWQAIKSLIIAEEYFLTVANHHNPYGEKRLGPIKYEYMSNTFRSYFYTFVKEHIKNLDLKNYED
jgi:hypothetical protein